MIRWIRRIIGLSLLAWAAWQVVVALSRPLYGILPWGDPTGLRINPLHPAEVALARAREVALAHAWMGG